MRFWEPRLGAWVVQVLPGELYVTRVEEVIATVLGSCVSACVRDRARNIGGMNHFMLPEAPAASDATAPARYGVYALECLLNSVLRGGGRREDLEVKVFGGGRVLHVNTDVGRANIEFVNRFFADERITITSADVGDTVARRLRYWPLTGRVQLMRMPIASARSIVEEEARAATRITPSAGTVELF